jgi:phosphatidylinositol-bisphosphatase
MKGSLGPSEHISIDFTILLDKATIPALAGGGFLDEIRILEIRNGRHIFLSLQGEFQRTCFGVSLQKLAALGGKGIRNVDPGAAPETGGGMPDELWRMTDFIMNYGWECGNLFLERGDEGLCREIRECLDTAQPFGQHIISEGDIGVLSMGETLLRFLESLPDSVIPSGVYDKVIRLGESKAAAIQVFQVFGD